MGLDEEEEAATKADIFHRRTVNRVVEPTRDAEPDEALAHSTQWRGRVDLDYIAQLLQADRVAVACELEGRGLIYRNPDTGEHETADAYLSGNVKRKLHSALAAGTSFEPNVRALGKVIPEDLPPASIEPRLGGVDPGGVGRGLLGQVGAFELYVFVGHEFDAVHLYLKSEAIHDCRPCQTGPALYQALRDTIVAVPDRRPETERKLASTRRRLDDLREELVKLFEHEERLTALLGRQRELAAELDLDKDETGTQGMEASEESLAA